MTNEERQQIVAKFESILKKIEDLDSEVYLALRKLKELKDDEQRSKNNR